MESGPKAAPRAGIPAGLRRSRNVPATRRAGSGGGRRAGTYKGSAGGPGPGSALGSLDFGPPILAPRFLAGPRFWPRFLGRIFAGWSANYAPKYAPRTAMPSWPRAMISMSMNGTGRRWGGAR